MKNWQVAIVVLALVTTAPALASSIQVVDGDTITDGSTTFRLYGIDTPERGQTCNKRGGGTWRCGREATNAVEKMVVGRDVTCDSRGQDDYGRTLAICWAGGIQINSTLVETGLAWSFRLYANEYDAIEDDARARGVGVWQAETQTPWDYRAARWVVAEQVAPDGCPIKGNINRKGERIYHAPWSPWYSRTKISPEKGERWFCDEGEALLAGWRAPRWGR